MIRTLITLILFGALQHPLLAENLQCVAISDVPSSRGIPLAHDRVIAVPEPAQPQALGMLGAQSFARLLPSQVNELLRLTVPLDTRQMLLHQAEDADAKAIKCQKLAAMPFFAASKERNLKNAKRYEDYASYTRGLPNDLVPYLVRTKDASGVCQPYLQGQDLHVGCGYLAGTPVEARDVAVLIFVEAAVNNISVSYAAAE